MADCNACDGSGSDPLAHEAALHPCKVCGGTGKAEGTPPMTNDKALEAALSALPGEAEVVGYLNWSELRQHRYFDDSPRGQREAWPLVTLTSLQAMQARAEKAERERDEAQASLKVVQNAAKTLASCQGTELEHLRQNANYDHRLRAEHQSLMDRDAQMTDALLAAEARVKELEAKLSEAADEIESWGAYASEYFQEKHDLPGVVREFREFTLKGGSNG
jgi:predicted RNase H-like nuclease (RuvC/YqgF family)